MKSTFFLLAFFLLVSSLNAQTWSWSSDQLKSGQDVIVTVKDIDIEEDMHVVGYYFHGKDLVSSDINYIVENDALKLTLKVPEETNWIRLVVKDENNQPVAGDHRDVMFAGAPSGSSLVDYANATTQYSRALGLTRDEVVATKLYRDAIAASPTWLDNPVVIRHYYMMAKASQAQEDVKRITSHISACDAQAAAMPQDMLISSIRIAKESGDSVLVKSLRRKLDASYPQSLISQEDQLMQFRNASNLADRILIRDKFRSTYPINEFNRGLYDQMTTSLVEECASKDEWEKVETYINEIMDPSTKANVCNSYAWTLVGEGMDKEPVQLELASRLSATSLSTLSSGTKPPSILTKSEWERNLEFSKATFGDTYALILYKQGKYNDAVEKQKFAVEKYKFEDAEMNERYLVYLEKANKKEEALSFIEDMIKKGTATAMMKSRHEQIWTSEKSADQLYDRYIAELESVAKARRLAEIQSMWMDASASTFTLKNLDGKSVSLNDYKGKTIVLDFWATWCGPCKSSFPGMKNAVEHFAADKDVVFLFVDTWETGDNVHDKVSKFISENKYPFHVLMDSKSEVVTQYKVDGIPTKFIIDGDQKIRFKSVGYGGNNDVLVEELITMIEMAKNNGKTTRS